MTAITNLGALWRKLFLLRLKLSIFLHYLPLVTKGALTQRRFRLFLQRLLLFLSRLDHNKFFRVAGRTRLDLYVPSFPGPAFYHACDKFLVFDEPPPPVTALISLTSACRFSCPHCYQRHDHGRDLPLEILLPVIERLEKQGVAFFNLEGGDPFLVYERLRRVCAAVSPRAEVWVNSTGDGITLERLRELKDLSLSAVMFSLHTSDPEKLNSFMGSKRAWEFLSRGVELCHQAGVLVAFNSCLGRDAFYDGEFERVMERARQFGGCLVQLIKPKSAGAALGCTPPFSQEDLRRVAELTDRFNHDPVYARYPAVAAQVVAEDASRFGCTAGGTDRFYINAKGDVQPCEFLNISFGNLAEEDFGVIYSRMRKAFYPAGEKWLCEGCAHHIQRLFARNPGRLPLNRVDSAEVCSGWDRGRPTDLYAAIDRLR